MLRQKKVAQSMVEVAIFGAIVVGLISTIVTSVTSTSFSQQYVLRTMREALTQAQQKTTVQDLTWGTIRVQKPYNLLVIEDRLSTGVSKYGTTQRMPYSYQANGLFSKDLFRGTTDLNNAPDYGTDDLPMLHMRINGVMFSFPMAAWRRFDEATDHMQCATPIRQAPAEDARAWTTEPLSATDKVFVDTILYHGSIMCYKSPGNYLMRVFQRPGIDDIEYYAMDPSLYWAHSVTNPVINPYDPTQGLDRTNTIETRAGGSLVIPDSGTTSVSTMDQTDVVWRRIKTNAGYQWLGTTIRSYRRHPWE